MATFTDAQFTFIVQTVVTIYVMFACLAFGVSFFVHAATDVADWAHDALWRLFPPLVSRRPSEGADE